MASENILILGNGFDLYHGLPTRYTDFLTLVKNWNDFYEDMPPERELYWKEDYPGYVCPKIELESNMLTSKDIKKFLEIDPVHYKYSNIERLNNEISNNIWIKYFVDSGYKKENWIDFEGEIEKVVLMVKHFYDTLPELYDKKIENSFDKETLYIIEIFSDDSKGFPLEKSRSLLMDDINQSRIDELKKKTIETMRTNLNGLIECLKLYFVEFVDKIKITLMTPVISKIDNPYVLNFNYTDFISRYSNVDAESIHYIHGAIRDDTLEYNNMVLGINDENVNDNDFVYFFKYFQRIQKRTGNQYKHWEIKVENGYVLAFKVYIFGHSLDANDKSILSYFLESRNVCKIAIFYHNQTAYEMQVINLIKMFGKDFVIENVSKNRIQFFSIQESELSNLPLEIK